MNTFPRLSTGLNGLDKILDGLRLGDNIVWQVDQIEDYQHFVRPILVKSIENHGKVIYLRFGQHPPLIEDNPQVKTYYLDPTLGFEAFSSRIYNIASEEGMGVYYIFDCLSDLLPAWATDLMIGNFFRVVCPYLYELNAIGYFTVLRNSHSYETIARIRETTQLLIDVYQHEGTYYVHPIKVLGRYSPTMFLPHVEINNDFVPMTSSVQAAHFFRCLNSGGRGRRNASWITGTAFSCGLVICWKRWLPETLNHWLRKRKCARGFAKCSLGVMNVFCLWRAVTSL
ncbi:hypothetical protein [Syntrophomonas palmitatica]|uniref:hypothetical protein n=1 Tax=Syntrophomonas palmitatica TaxID=402877 RepID=UPI0006D19038|nr:hypothetical protein [Syntrophomonas palmitatica]